MSAVDRGVPDTSRKMQAHGNWHHNSKENANCDIVIHGTHEQIQLEQE